MQINLERPDTANIVRQLETDAGGFRIIVGENSYGESVIITPQTLDLWGVAAVSEMTLEHFNQAALLCAEVVLLGTGGKLVFPAASLYRVLLDQGIGVEVMDTPAACRTYNILAGDGRRVAAALIL